MLGKAHAINHKGTFTKLLTQEAQHEHSGVTAQASMSLKGAVGNKGSHLKSPE